MRRWASRSVGVSQMDEAQLHFQSMDRPVTSITEFIGVLQHRWPMAMPFFRGESTEFETPMVASIWRDSPSNPWSSTDLRRGLNPSSVWTAAEDRAIEAFKEWAGDSLPTRDRFLSQYGLPDDPYSPEWIPLAQHFGFPTRLIDVTLDPFDPSTILRSRSSDLMNKGDGNSQIGIGNWTIHRTGERGQGLPCQRCRTNRISSGLHICQATRIRTCGYQGGGYVDGREVA